MGAKSTASKLFGKPNVSKGPSQALPKSQAAAMVKYSIPNPGSIKAIFKPKPSKPLKLVKPKVFK